MPGLDDKKKALLARLLAKEGLSQIEPARIAPRTSSSPASLSFAQRRLWLLEQMALPGPPAYNMPAAYLIDGSLDIDALDDAFNRLLGRHDILRTGIVSIDGEPRQVLNDDARLHIVITDLTADDDAIATFSHQAKLLAQTPFDLTVAPLLRVAVAKLGPTRHGLAVVLHHIVADGWSLPILMREVMAAYADARQGRASTLPPLTLQYADYADWHRARIESGELDAHGAFWKRAFADPPPPLDLPSDHARPAERSFHGASVRRTLNRELTARLRGLSRDNDASLFMTLVAVVNLLLARYSGQRDIVVGSPMAGRVRAELADQLGFYVNMLPLRTSIDERESFRSLLGRVARATGEALEHEIYPFDQLVHELHLDRDLGRSPLFDVVVVVDKAGDAVLGFEGLTVQPIDLPRESSKFDLTFHFVEFEHDVELTIEYSLGLFEHARVERMAQHLEQLVRSVSARPDDAVGTLSLLPTAERQQILAWSGVRSAVADCQCVVDLFEAQAQQRPAQVALTFGSEHVTYAALNARANQVAQRLAAHGVGPEVRVGICVDRSPDLLVAILAVLKAGGAYVPLDPSYPPERLQYLVADSGVTVVLTHGGIAQERLAAWSGTFIDITDCVDEVDRNPARHTHADQSAYVIYTSGSTGQPKGCVVTHGNLARLMTSTAAWYRFDEHDVWTLFHSYAFDFSVWEIWGALAYGGRLVVVPYWISRAPDAFLDLLSAEGVTVLNQTPSAFRELVRVDTDAPRQLALRYVIFGGEALDIPALAPWFRTHPDTSPQLVNMYGITETTVHVTYRPVGVVDVTADSGSVIGSPIPDLSVYLLDASLAPVPIGVNGELYVGGAGVCRGYLNRPALTAERFVPDPFSSVPGARLYRSGDVGRWTASGDIEYLGRADTQVKIRGFRIEIGEIEAALRAQPAVTDAIVVARDHGGTKQLVAYVVAPPTSETAALRPALAQMLPDYMVPAHIVRIDARPLTAHGKLDVRALPEPEGAVVSTYAAPRSEAERALCEIWSSALGVAEVGIDDNYFELGGDSILALRVIASARERSVHFGIRDLYQRRTIRALVSSEAEDVAAIVPETVAPFALITAADRALLPAAAEDAYPLSRLQAGMFFHSALDPESAVFHDVFSYRLKLPFHKDAFTSAAKQLVARHPILRTSFHWEPYSEPLQVVWRSASADITVDDLRERPAAEHDTRIAEGMESRRRRRFDASQPSLFRISIHVRGDDDLQVTADFHHAILDGWSFATLMAELVSHYLDLVEGRSAEPPTPARRFNEFIALERAASSSDESRRYWSDRVADLPATRIPRWPGAPFGNGARSHEVALPSSANIHAVAQQLGVPVKNVCLAAHAAVLAMLAGDTEIVTGLTTNGRPDAAGAEQVLGLFLNTVPFRLDVRRDSWRALVERGFDTERSLLPHRRFPLPAIKALAGGRELYDAGFNFVHFHVYKTIGERVQVTDLSAFEQTDYAFVANFSIDPRDHTLALRLSYDAAQFPAEQIAAIGRYYARAMAAIIASPEASWCRTTLLDTSERQAQIDLARGPDTPRPAWTLVSRFEEHVRQSPESVAVWCGNRSLSYRELNDRSNRVAHLLAAHGVGRDQPVGLCMPRSEWLLVSLLGVLKAGAAYVPIDVSYPDDRIAFILSDSGARVVLSDGSRPGIDVTTTSLRMSADAVEVSIDPAQLAYIIYTSGSTGRPKGAMLSHGALAHYLAWAIDAYRVTETSRSIVHSSVSFDATITSLLTPLLTGGAVELVPEDRAVLSLAAALASDTSYSVVKITPAHLDLLRHELGDAGPRASVGAFVIGGEALLDASLAWWREVAPTARLINEYGPTETVVGCAVFEDRGQPGPAAVPIGRPIDRMRIYVLDRHFEPVPMGSTGEIFVSGAGVARGYLGRPDLSAERFVPDPFDANAGARMYRTGDLGRWRPDGQLEYLGRNDFQVKVRGHRVELGEIEAVLSEHPAITEAAVVAKASGGTHELIAFVVGAAPTLESIRGFLTKRLPEPLIPGRFVVLPHLPLTPNGKVDRDALMRLDGHALQSASPFVAPQSDAERAIAKIWESVLDKPRVGVTDEYFSNGGDSLKALQVVSRAARDGWRLRVRDVFDFPTIAELARHAVRETIVIDQRAVDGLVPLTPIQHWFFEDHPGPYHHFNQAVSLRWRGRVDARALAEALTALATHHDALRMRFNPSADSHGGWIQTNPPAAVAVEVVPADGMAGADQLQASLDPTTGRVIRAAVFHEANDDRVVLAIHHLVVDGVSWRILLEDLDVAYEQRRAGRVVALPPKTQSFLTWAQRVVEYAKSDMAMAELPYWQRVVANHVALPAGGPATADAPHVVNVSLDQEATARLLGEAHRAYRTQANDLLLTGLAMALESAFGTRQSLISIEGHGRHEGLDLDVSRTVGWFTSRYPVALTLAADTLREQIRRIKEDLRAVPSRGFGYGVLRYLGSRDVARSLECAPAIGFNYLGRFDEARAARSFDVTNEPTGAVADARWPRDHDLDVVATVFNGQLDIRVESTRGRIDAARAAAFADAFVSSLRVLADHCTQAPGEPTPSDLTFGGLSLGAFDALLDRHQLTADAVEDVLPLSPMQEGFLFHALSEQSGAYFEQSAYQLSGQLQPRLFEQAWNQLLQRHPNLRVAYWHEDLPRPVQAVLRDRRVEFLFEDWRGQSAPDQRARLASFRAAERQRAFNLGGGALVRVALFQTGDTTFDAVWGFPHLLLDGWSAGILLGELLAIYAGLVDGYQAVLPEPVPYRRYLQWLERQPREASADFWREYLSNYDETSSLPAERRGGVGQHYEPLSLPWSLGVDETRQLKALASQLHVTVSTAVQTLWAMLLSAYSERRDVVFGATVSGRPETLAGVEQMVGLFINTLPVRVRMHTREGFADIAKRLQVETLASHAHASCALADIQAESVLNAHLFDHILVFENYPLDQQLRKMGSILKVESSDVFEQVHYDLGLLVADGAEQLEMRFIANGAAYPETRLRRVMAHFRELTRSVLADPQRPAAEHAILPTSEREQLARFNQTAGQPRTGVTLVDLINEQAATTPDAVALVHGVERLTYRELHARADAVARVLRSRGVGPETLVGVLMTRRADLIVALTAVLKAGGAYVPLDPTYPADRLRFLLSDAAMAQVITERSLRSMIPAADASVICVDEELPAAIASTRPSVALSPDNLAYIIYTSGSTGTPKGTAISHKAAAALVEWGRHTYSPDELRGVLASTSISFDLSVFEIFVTLSTGGTIVLADNALALPTLPAADEVTLVNTVPSAMAELVRTGALPSSVHTVNLAGEPLPASLVDALYGLPDIRRVCDLYGPSEDTTYSTYALRERGGPETIGGPITHSHTEIYLLNQRLEPVPIGAVGELYISSDKLCRGYLNRPDMTAERFIPNPVTGSGARMYRTGDVARYRDDGRIEFLGRIDHQVKIRGFRIELGEIESALENTAWLRDVAVVAREDAPGAKVIVAYLVAEDAAPQDAATYRTALAQTLPEYMIPAAFVFLDRLPLTPNGKLDRRALPAPDVSSSHAEPPRTELETILADVWRDALELDRVGIFDNFFDHGGHSLKAARMVSRARLEHGLDFSLRDLFTHPTVAELAEEIAARRRVAHAPIPAIPDAADYALSYGQRRLWVLEQLRGDGPAAYNVPAAFVIRGTLDVPALEAAFHRLIQRHEVLRTRIVTIDGEPRQQVVDASQFRLGVVDLSTIPNPLEAFDRELRAFAHAPFDLSTAPLVRVLLRRLGPDSHGLGVVIHHIATDGWSIPILMRELVACYRDGVEGRTASLPSLPLQYRDYAAWQHAALNSDAALTHREYWQSVFAEPPLPLELPTDRARPAVQTFEGDQFRITFDLSLSAAVRALAAEHGASVFMTLLAAMNVLLARMSGQRDITVGSPMAGRTHPDLDDQIGYFVNTVPLRTILSGEDTFTTLLKRTRESVTAAFEHQAYPFDRLVDDLDIPRDMARSPLFDVMVAMENNERGDLALAGLQIDPLALDYRISKFDLTTTFRETEGAIETVFEFNTALFDRESIARMARRFDMLVRGVVAQPHGQVERVPMLPAAEQRAVESEWNWQPLARSHASLATLFEAQAARTPDAIALVFEGRELTYRALDRRSNDIARQLTEIHAIRQEEPVGLMAAASDHLIVGMLGILKAGCAYVPVDPGYPSERNRWVLENAGIRVLVKTADVPLITTGLAMIDPAAAVESDVRTWRSESDESLAYILYTSGSTGRPKGVEVPHRGVINLLADVQRRAPISAGDGCALWTSTSFDVSVYEIFSALLTGGRLCVATEALRGHPTAYFEWLTTQQIASAYVAPFQLTALCEYLRSATTKPPLSRLLVGVEPIEEALLTEIRDLLPGLRVINGYGPTEATICATLYDVDGATRSRVTPIGRAVVNTAAIVVDARMQAAGIGVAGELVLAGDGLARGYHRDPAATAAAFVPNPFGPPGSRAYRTGDMARRLADGNLMFAGRADHQVKIRGHRVEIGEVERALRSADGVADAAVVARTAGQTRELIGFVVTTADEPTAESLRAHLAGSLPDYMIPARFVVVDTMPMTPNGKVDRRQLSERDGQALRIESGYVAPRTANEQTLASVWMDVLGADRVGINDNFFALGGDSIKAIQITSRASGHGLTITIRDLFAHPTVAELAAAAIDRTRAIAQGPVVGNVPLTAIQQWFFQENPGPHDHFNQAVLLRSADAVDEVALRLAVSALVDHHDMLRARFTREETSAWTQTIESSAEVDWIVEDWRALSQADAVARMSNMADRMHASRDLVSGRLVGAALFRLPDADRVLLVIHHLVVDGVSWRILLEDLETAYRQAMTGIAPKLPAKTDAFASWAAAARAHAQSVDAESERDYWTRLCSSSSDPLATDQAVGVRDTVRVKLGVEDTRALKASAHTLGGADTATLLLAGCAVAIQQVFGRARTIIDLEGHGRESSVADLEVDRTVGWFTSLYPFMLVATEGAAEQNAALRASIDQTRDSMRRVPQNGVGYGLLRYLSAHRGESLGYRADVGFNYLGEFGRSSAETTFTFAAESSGASVSANWTHAHALDISTHIEGGQCHLAATFDTAVISPALGRQLLDSYSRHLVRIARLIDAETIEFQSLLARHRMSERDVEATMPLSPMQEGMLFSALFNRESSAYFEQIAYRIKGDVDPAAFETAWNTLLERHANLRVSIWHDQVARPMAVVHRRRQIELTIHDWTRNTVEEQRAQLSAYRAQDRRRGFDLEHDPLMRFALFRSAESSWDVVWSYPHLLLDGWSAGTLIGEFLSIYDEANSLPAPVPYSRYIEWLSQQDHDAAIRRWTGRLDNYDETASVPRDVMTASPLSAGRATTSWTMSPEQTRRLTDAGKQHGLTMNTIVQALWGVLVGRLNDRNDVVFGATVSGRPEQLDGIEGMVGLFINTLPVRVRWSEQEAFVRLAQRLQRESLDAQRDGFVPLADIQAASPAGASLFDHLVIFENYPLDERVRMQSGAQSRWSIESVDVFEETHYPLVLAVAPLDGRFEFRCAYDPAVYSAERIARLRQQWEHLIDSVGTLDQTLVTADIVTSVERTRVAGFARGLQEAAPDATLGQLLDEAIGQEPARLAVAYGDVRVSQRELHDRAAQVSAALRAAGVEQDAPVAICLDRSIELVVGLVGIVKSGGAYVPVDPEYPAARIDYILNDCNCPAVVTRRGLLPDDVAPGIRRVFVDDVVEVASPVIEPSPESLAYILYTSGSTGRPKGVGIPHRALTNHMRWMSRGFPLASDDRVLQKTPFSFDASVWEFWAPLIEGATLVMAEPGVHQDPARLADVIRRERITVLQLVPTMLQALLEEPAFRLCTDLRRVFVGGEALGADLQERFFDALPATRLINLYGPTETTIDAVTFECRPGMSAPVPIGAPVDGLIAYVFDQRMEPSAVGVWGELFLGGAGVGRGYVGRPELTAEAFCPDHVSGRAGARLYRTGDRARWREDGLLEYGGRRDDQVKLRGFRIELGEVEAALRHIEGITEAAALVVASGTELCAFIVASNATPAATELRDRLRHAGLPASMIPGRIIMLESLPRTTSGKLDRRALIGLVASSDPTTAFVAPRNAQETAIAAIWATALRRDQLSVTDNFFDLGGHSLTAARVAAQLSRDLSTTVSVRDIFAYPTVSDLAAYLTAAAWAATSKPSDGSDDDTHGDVTL